MRHSSSQLTLQGAGCDRQWIVQDGVGPTARTGRPLCCSRPQQMLVQMPGTSVSLTSLIATTLHGPEMALGQRPGNSLAANTPYTCLTLHNVVEWITDSLVCCVELNLPYSLIGIIHGAGQHSKMSCGAPMQHLVLLLPTLQVRTNCSCMHCYRLVWTHCPALRTLTLSCLSSSVCTCLCTREREKGCVCFCSGPGMMC